MFKQKVKSSIEKNIFDRTGDPANFFLEKVLNVGGWGVGSKYIFWQDPIIMYLDNLIRFKLILNTNTKKH